MFAIIVGNRVYVALAAGVLLVHALFVLWVATGTLVTRSRPVLRWFHISSLFWGILAEVAPWPCPLTIMENWLEARAGVQPYQGGFLLHYLDALVYPNISGTVLMIAGIAVCLLNLAIYARRFRSRHAGSLSIRRHQAANRAESVPSHPAARDRGASGR